MNTFSEWLALLAVILPALITLLELLLTLLGDPPF